MRFYVFGGRILGMRVGASVGPEDFRRRKMTPEEVRRRGNRNMAVVFAALSVATLVVVLAVRFIDDANRGTVYNPGRGVVAQP